MMEKRVRSRSNSKFMRMVRLFQYEIIALFIAMVVCGVFFLNQAMNVYPGDSKSRDAEIYGGSDLDE